MSKGVEKLQEIGTQKIHEDTHISREHVQALLHGSFDSLNKIQFLGFISILEKNYTITLDELKEKGLEYFEDKNAQDKDKHKIFIVPERRKSYKKFYITVVVLIFIIAVVYRLFISFNVVNNQVIDNTIIDNAKDNIEIVEDINTTLKDENVSEEIIATQNSLVIEEPTVVEKNSFKVIPHARLWIGYIDMSTHKKLQKTFKGELDLDPDKQWLLSLGHGNVSFEIDGEVKEFNSKKNIRFIYKDGNLTEITFKEFKRLNKGSAW